MQPAPNPAPPTAPASRPPGRRRPWWIGYVLGGLTMIAGIALCGWATLLATGSVIGDGLQTLESVENAYSGPVELTAGQKYLLKTASPPAVRTCTFTPPAGQGGFTKSFAAPAPGVDSKYHGSTYVVGTFTSPATGTFTIACGTDGARVTKPQRISAGDFLLAGTGTLLVSILLIVATLTLKSRDRTEQAYRVWRLTEAQRIAQQRAAQWQAAQLQASQRQAAQWQASQWQAAQARAQGQPPQGPAGRPPR